ncbi:hypothetical protein CSW57_18100 [Williamsia muralis]|uniref:Uncharacterized protein n=1 Tax=Williamsia marianensis TaxID=85044 RepID=A0A2G3PIM2_WILMA|nr:hypothetical protein CSW57_18100 [Williamsia marianensis]
MPAGPAIPPSCPTPATIGLPTLSSTVPAMENGDGPAIGAPVTGTGCPFTTMCPVGANSSARVAATTAVASARPSAAAPSATA